MDFNELNKQSYNKIAGQFSRTRSYVWRDIESFRDYVKDGDKVLDLGCGNGRLIKLFEKNAETEYHSVSAGNCFDERTGHCSVRRPVRVEYFGVDFSEKLIEIARKNYPEKKFAVMDALNLDLLEKTFDVVLSVSVLNHFAKENHRRFIENVKRVLKPDGYLLMSNWNMWNMRNKKAWRGLKIKDLRLKSVKDRVSLWKDGGVNMQLYYYAFTKNELAKLLKYNGFQVVKNFYSKKGRKSNWLFGENIVTIAKL